MEEFAVVVRFLTLLVRAWIIIEPTMNPGQTGDHWREHIMYTGNDNTEAADTAPPSCNVFTLERHNLPLRKFQFISL